MDLLALPTGIDKSILGLTPFVGGNLRWDGGSFLHYGCRNGLLQNVPLHLRHCDCPVPFLDRKYFKPLGQGEKEAIFQTWLFFGLLAEFFGLNDRPGYDGESAGPHREAALADEDRDARIEALYASFVKPTLDLDGTGQAPPDVHVHCAALDDPIQVDKIIRHLVAKWTATSDQNDTIKYFAYLRKSLKFVNEFVSSLSTSELDFKESISVSIVALGEVCYSVLVLLTKELGLSRGYGIGKWSSGYLKSEGRVSSEMLARGWCISDIERIRQYFNGLATQYFLSHLEKPATHSHDLCSLQMCKAAQINPATYVLTHHDGCGGCDIIGVDQEAVKRVLRQSDAFPVLHIELGEGDGRTKIRVEQHDTDKPYVALSHVWADGLGNPTSNALQSCQMDRLVRLIRALPSRPATNQAEGSEKNEQPPYRLWIDTLCCPITADEKLIALERMAAVYRGAAHVLVLDRSITPFDSAGDGAAQAAENCLRILGSATWMRRLWTLQEGALAKSLYFQFRDRAIDLAEETERLRLFGREDMRFSPIAEDVQLMTFRLAALCSKKGITIPPQSLQGRWREARTSLERIHTVQSSICFRGASVASDEPLCVATLLALDPQAMTGLKRCRQERMHAVWKLLVAESGGFFTARIIFFNDQPLGLASMTGWRWAPATLFPLVDTGYSHDTLTSRFHPPDTPGDMGVATEHGLEVTFPGMRVTLRPWAEHESGRLWPWHLLTRRSVECQLYCRHRSTGQWFTLSEERGIKQSHEWTREEARRRDKELLELDKSQSFEGRRPSQPVFNELCRGELALIRDTLLPGHVGLYAVSRIKTTRGADGALYVDVSQAVSITEMARPLWPGLDMLQDLAMRVYASEVNQELLRFLARQDGGRDPDFESEECKDLEARLRQEMQRAADDALAADEDGHLGRLSVELMGEGKEANVWKALPGAVPFQVSVDSLPDDQVWIVDRPVVGDGLCHDECCSLP